MKKSPEKIESTINLSEFGKSMAQLDLKGVPSHKKQNAVIDHLMKIMSETVENPITRAEIRISRKLHHTK